MCLKCTTVNNCCGRNVLTLLKFIAVYRLIAYEKELPRTKLFCIIIERGMQKRNTDF